MAKILRAAATAIACLALLGAGAVVGPSADCPHHGGGLAPAGASVPSPAAAPAAEAGGTAAGQAGRAPGSVRSGGGAGSSGCCCCCVGACQLCPCSGPGPAPVTPGVTAVPAGSAGEVDVGRGDSLHLFRLRRHLLPWSNAPPVA